jgi:ATP-dependent DNA ligase
LHPLACSQTAVWPRLGARGLKHDGYRLIVRRDGKVARLFTRRGYDWTDRYPAIAAAAAKLRAVVHAGRRGGGLPRKSSGHRG